MNILIVDGQGGRIGAKLVELLSDKLPDTKITAVGTNSMATSAMIKAGAKLAATGENAIKVNAGYADIIVGPIGIAIADSLLGEITPEAAKAIGSSPAKKVLIPTGKCDIIVAGSPSLPLGDVITEAVSTVVSLVNVSAR